MDAALHDEALRRQSQPEEKVSIFRQLHWLAAGAAAVLALAGW